MKRTQLYLDDDLWDVLHVRAREAGQTMSDLVRQAVRERYLGPAAQRKQAMQAVVGLWSDRTDIGDTDSYVRKLRKGSRLERIAP